MKVYLNLQTAALIPYIIMYNGQKLFNYYPVYKIIYCLKSFFKIVLCRILKLGFSRPLDSAVKRLEVIRHFYCVPFINGICFFL